MTNHNGKTLEQCIWKDIGKKYPERSDKTCLKCRGYDSSCQQYLSNADVNRREEERMSHKIMGMQYGK